VIRRDTPSTEHFKAGVACGTPRRPAQRHLGLPQVRRKMMSEPRIFVPEDGIGCFSDTYIGIRYTETEKGLGVVAMWVGAGCRQVDMPPWCSC